MRLRCYIHSYLSSPPATARGFTLTEMLVSLAIISIITSITLFQFQQFDGNVILKSSAYEAASLLREAQTYAVGVRGADGTFDAPYGVSFQEGGTEYMLFTDSDRNTPPRYNAGEELETVAIARGGFISDLCVVTASGEECDIPQLDISFERPEFDAVFGVAGYRSGDISHARVSLANAKSDITWNVVINQLGQIEVVLIR